MELTRVKRPGYLVMAGGVLLVFGSFLPWVKVTAPLIGTVTRSGMDAGGDGWFTLFFGIGLIFAGYGLYMSHRVALRIVVTIVAIVTMGLTVFEFVDIQKRFDEASEETSDFVAASHGLGLYVLAGGAILAFVGALDQCRSRQTASGEPDGDDEWVELPPEGWYPYPAGSTEQQGYWDGTAWTERRRRHVPPGGSDA